MPRISLPKSGGSSEKVVVSLSGQVHADVVLYGEFIAVTDGGSVEDRVHPPKVAKLMIETFLAEDKEFLAWKKKRKNAPVESPNHTSEIPSATSGEPLLSS